MSQSRTSRRGDAPGHLLLLLLRFVGSYSTPHINNKKIAFNLFSERGSALKPTCAAKKEPTRQISRFYGQTDMARSTRPVMLLKKIYTLWGRNRFLLPVTYFTTNLVYPLTLRVTGITKGH